MINFYSNNVNDLFEYEHPSAKITLNDIYAQTYNVSNASAMRMTNNYNFGNPKNMARHESDSHDK